MRYSYILKQVITYEVLVEFAEQSPAAAKELAMKMAHNIDEWGNDCPFEVSCIAHITVRQTGASIADTEKKPAP